ncbi:MAG: hypothetical protein IKH11_06050 [Bacteroidales bacterium]|nr:hypothetical protein [Bacteroidales bacterium]
MSDEIFTQLPLVQTAVPGSFDPLAMIAVGKAYAVSGQDFSMSFYNVCAGFCFTLGSNAASYSRITIEGNSGETVGGPVTVSLASLEDPSFTPEASPVAANVISLLPPLDESGAPTSFTSDTEYSIVLLPGDFDSGFTMKFYGSNDQLLQTCVCTSYVSFRRGRFGMVNDVDNPEKLASIRDGEDLSLANGPANCYIVSAPGSYKFPTVRGNDPDNEITSIDRVAVLWETNNTSSAPASGSIVGRNVTYNRSFVYFDIPTSMTNGNALIAAYHNDEIVWSWHIWVCRGYDPEATAQQLAGKPSVMLDRNIGALSPLPSILSNGLFYQWGRKDPFPGAAQSYAVAANGGTQFATTGSFSSVSAVDVNSTMDYAIANPTTFVTAEYNWLRNNAMNNLWADQKTIYDPCPPGWRVPHAYYVVNKVHVKDNEAWTDVPEYPMYRSPYEYGSYFSLDQSTERAWYPMNGFLDPSSGTIMRVGQYALYWSCSPSSNNSYGLSIMADQNGNVSVNATQYGKPRAEGHSIRCIAE